MPTASDQERQTRLPPRRGGIAQHVWATLGLLMFAGILVAMVVYTGPPLVSDWRIHADAQPVKQGRLVEGSCSTKLVLAICNVTLTNRAGSATITRSVNYVFTDLHFGDYSIEVVADPAHPDLVSTDLGLDKLWNRTFTFLFATALMLGFLALPVIAFFRNRRTLRTTAPG